MAGEIVIRPGHDPLPGTVDVKEAQASTDPDLATLAGDVFFVRIEDDPYDQGKEVIEVPVSIRGSVDHDTYLRHRRTLGMDATVNDQGLATAKSMIVIGPAYQDAGIMFGGSASTGEIFLDYDVKAHKYVLKGKNNQYAGKFSDVSLIPSTYTVTNDQITWTVKYGKWSNTGTIRQDVGQAAYEGLKTYLVDEKHANQKPVTLQDTTAFYDFQRSNFYFLTAAQTQAYAELKEKGKLNTIPSITFGEMLYAKDSGLPLLCLDKAKKEIVFPPPKDWKTDGNIELISLRNFSVVDKESEEIELFNPLAEALMPWFVYEGGSAQKDDAAFMVALVRFGFLKDADSVNISQQQVTFTNDTLAYDFVNGLFGVGRRKDLPSAEQIAAAQRPEDLARLASARAYTTPGGEGLHFWFFEGAQVTTSMRNGVGTDDNAMWSIAQMDDVRFALESPEESWHNYTSAIPEIGIVPAEGDCRYDAIILPILTDTESGKTEVYLDASLFTAEGIKRAADNFQLPPGKRLPTEDELARYYNEAPLHRYQVPNKPGFHAPITNEFGYPVGSITVVSDKQMVRIGTTGVGNPMPVAFVHAFYQPATQFQLIGGQSPADQQPHGGWTDLPGWYSYEQAYMMQQMLNLANQEGGYESTIRRIEEDGFRYENPDNSNGLWQDMAQVFDYFPVGIPGGEIMNWSRNEPTDGKVKVARYAIQFDLTMFADQAAKIDTLIAVAEAQGLNYIESESGCAGQMSLDDAREYSRALWMASKGSWEGLKEQIKKNPWGAAGTAFTLALILSISWVGIKALAKKIDRKLRGTLPAGLEKANATRIKRLDPTRYQGQDRVRRKIYNYLERKARGEKCKSLLLVGPPGVGKTALINSVFSEFLRNEPELAAKLRLMFGNLSALAKELGIVGEDARLAEPFWDTILSPGGMTAIDEIHQLVGVGITTGRTTDAVTEYPLTRLENGVDAKDRVNGGLIGMTTLGHYREMQERNSAFVARFEVVTMDNTTEGEREKIVSDIAQERQRETHRVYTDEAIAYYNGNYMAIDSSKHANRAAVDNFDTIDMEIAAMIANGDLKVAQDSDGNYIITADHLEIAIRRYQETRQAASFEDSVADLRRILTGLTTRYGFDPRAVGLGTPEDFAHLGRKRTEADWAPALFRVRRVIGLLQTLEERAVTAQDYAQLQVLLGQVQNQVRAQQGRAPEPDAVLGTTLPPPTMASDPRAKAPQTAGEQWLASLAPGASAPLLQAFGHVRVIDDYLNRGFTPDHILALVPHMTQKNLLTRALLSPFQGPDGGLMGFTPDIILQLLNDPDFIKIVTQQGVNTAMIPAIVQIYTDPRAVQQGVYVLSDGQMMITNTTPPSGAIPAANFRPQPAPPSPAFGSANVDGDEVDGDDDTDPGATTGFRSGLVIRGAAEIQAELRGLLQANPTTAEARRDVLIYIVQHANMDAQGLCGLMYGQMQLIKAQATSQDLRLPNIENIQYAVIQATYTTIKQFETAGTTVDTDQLSAAIQRNVQVALDRAMSLPANASADLQARVDGYKAQVATGSSQGLTSFPSLTTRQRSR